MLRGASQDAGERRRVPNRLDGSILSLALLEPNQSLGMVGLDDLDLLHFHLDIMEFLVERRETRIHARTGTTEKDSRWISSLEQRQRVATRGRCGSRRVVALRSSKG